MSKPVRVESYTFQEVLAAMAAEYEARDKKLEAMTPEEREQWDKEQAEAQKEIDKMLEQLRGPGFLEL